VAYVSNAAGSAADLEAIRITGIECSRATQPFAISAETPYPQLVARLYQQLLDVESQTRFVDQGFHWKLDSQPTDEPGTTE
jgi:hypothetical protein